jgi:hypothetical protein
MMGGGFGEDDIFTMVWMGGSDDEKEKREGASTCTDPSIIKHQQ